jgi:uncharacterized protein (DUF2235 family)
MAKNIIICCDGTGNSFRTRASNVAQMVDHLDLSAEGAQVAVYDQGIGTDSMRAREIRSVHEDFCKAGTLRVLEEASSLWPAQKLRLLLGLAFGAGLRENIRQSYLTLADLYDHGDHVFLFGFSRGAFTVRALAGLIHRCGLPTSTEAKDPRVFEEAWDRYVPMQRRQDDTPARRCPIHFLGLWDTVKAYGAFRQIMLPHLRHNPIVTTVRHALALDEKRALFEPTTWGRLDRDRLPGCAMSRVPEPDLSRINDQNIEEVWFRGCHSDVGGGDEDTTTSRIALRWVLCGAHRNGLRLNGKGHALLQIDPANEAPTVHESDTWYWQILARLQRNKIDNSGEWPRLVRTTASEGPRHPMMTLREGKMTQHRSAGRELADGVSVVE